MLVDFLAEVVGKSARLLFAIFSPLPAPVGKQSWQGLGPILGHLSMITASCATSYFSGGLYTRMLEMGTRPSPAGMISTVWGLLLRPCASVVEYSRELSGVAGAW